MEKPIIPPADLSRSKHWDRTCGFRFQHVRQWRGIIQRRNPLAPARWSYLASRTGAPGDSAQRQVMSPMTDDPTARDSLNRFFQPGQIRKSVVYMDLTASFLLSLDVKIPLILKPSLEVAGGCQRICFQLCSVHLEPFGCLHLSNRW